MIKKFKNKELKYDVVEAEGNRIGVYDVVNMEIIIKKLEEVIDAVNQLHEDSQTNTEKEEEDS